MDETQGNLQNAVNEKKGVARIGSVGSMAAEGDFMGGGEGTQVIRKDAGDGASSSHTGGPRGAELGER